MVNLIVIPGLVLVCILLTVLVQREWKQQPGKLQQRYKTYRQGLRELAALIRDVTTVSGFLVVLIGIVTTGLGLAVTLVVGGFVKVFYFFFVVLHPHLKWLTLVIIWMVIA